jgi:hypothetical protein
VVQAALQAFLAAGELDDLAALRDAITTIDGDEAAALSAIVQAWSEPQAVANLLLYPELIPPPDRMPVLLRGLAAGADDYLALMAVVGLQRIAEEEIPVAVRPTVAGHLVRLVEQGRGPVAGRASLIIAAVAQDLDPAALLRLLAHPDPAVRHNLLVALLETFGLDRVVTTADAEVAAGRLGADAAAALREDLARAGLDPAAGVDDERVLDSPLGLPLLSYIPNYRDWTRPPVG